MATWKKLLVSGSDISQLNNDAGYLTSATALSAFQTASFDGVNLLADTSAGVLNFASSSGEGLTISADAGTDTLTFGLAGIPNDSLTNSTISIAGTSVALGGSITAATIGNAGGFFSGSSQVEYSGISNIPAGIVSGSSLSSPAQGEAVLTINGVAGATVDLGLQTTDSPQFNNLTVTGNLTVQGTQTSINTTNLDVEDRYVLLNSGSSTIGDSGIVFGGSNGTAQSGAAFIWDASYNSNDGRLAIVNNMAGNATGDQTPSYHVAGVFEGTEANAATAQADHVGNIRVDGEDIFIYV